MKPRSHKRLLLLALGLLACDVPQRPDNPYSQSLEILFGDGRGGVAGYRAVAAGDDSVCTGDFNSDGRMDVATVERSSGVQVFLASGAAGELAPSGILELSGGTRIRAGDLVGDGSLDLAVATSTGLAIFSGRGDGTFNPAPLLVSLGQGTDKVIGLVLADVDADGRLDAVVGFEQTGAWLCFNRGEGFEARRLSASSGVLGGMAVGDLDGDGMAEIALALQSRPARIEVFAHGEERLDAAATLWLPQPPVALVAGDFDGDGKLDLVAGMVSCEAMAERAYCSAPQLGFIRGLGRGSFDAPVLSQHALGSTAAADVNSDGKLDLVTGIAGEGLVRVLLGQGDGTFHEEKVYATAHDPRDLALADLDQDGTLDLIFATRQLGWF